MQRNAVRHLHVMLKAFLHLKLLQYYEARDHWQPGRLAY